MKIPLHSSLYTLNSSLCLFNKQTVTRHLCRLRNAHHVQHGGSQISQYAAFCQLALVTDHYERHRVSGVCGERSHAVSVEHLIDVAVVGGDQALAAHLEDGVNDLAYAVIGSLNSLDCSLEYAGVPDRMRFTHSSVTAGSLISGWRS